MKLNPDKTKVILVRKAGVLEDPVLPTFNGVQLMFCDLLKSLKTVIMPEKQASATVKGEKAFYHFHQAQQLALYWIEKATWIHAMTALRTDYDMHCT